MVCGKLAVVQATDGRLKDSQSTLEALLGRLEADSESAPIDLVDVSVQIARVQSASGDPNLAIETLRRALPYQGKLDPIERGLMFARIGDFYLPIDGATTGEEMLESAKQSVASAQDQGSPAHIRAVTEIAAILRRANQRDQAQMLLAPLLDEARRVFEGPEAPSDDLGEAYIEVGREISYVRLRQGLRASAAAAAELVHDWTTKLRGESDVLNVERDAVLAPKLRSKRDPLYTKGAASVGAEGTTVLIVEIWPDGRAHNVRVLEGLPYGLTWAAIAAVRKWKFEPGQKNGKPVKVSARIDVNFRMRQ